MASVSVQIADLPAMLASTDTAVREAIAYGCRAGAERARSYIVRQTPRDQGQLAASWRVHDVPGTENLLAELINDAPHIVLVELGSRPHGVNAAGWQAIYEWARRHLRSASGRLRPRARGFVAQRPFHGDDPVVERFTNAIVWKLRKFGQRATMFVHNALPAMVNLMAVELERAMRRVQAAP